MLALGRLERVHRIRAGIAGRLEGLGIGQVRHEARVEHIADRGVGTEVGVALGIGGIALVEELGAGMHPILTSAQGQAPVVEGHLVLDIKAGLTGLLVIVVEGRGAWRTGDRQAIDRVVDVNARGTAEDRRVVGVDALVVQADQQSVVDVAGGEVTLEVVVHGELADVFIDVGGATAGVALVVHDEAKGGKGRNVAVDGNLLELQVRLGVAKVLTELPDIVQAMLERVAHRVVGAVVEIVVRVTQVLVVGDLAERHVDLGALDREELAGDTGIVAGELRQQGEAGVFVDVPGQARGDVVALVVDVIDLGAAVTHYATDAVEELALLIDLAGAGEVDLAMVVAAVLELDFVAALGLRAAADHVQQAARRGLAIDRGGRAAQQGEAVQVPGFRLGVGIDATGQRQAVEELGRLEATHAHPVVAGVAAETGGNDTRHVAHGVVEAVYLAIVHLLASHHRNRARHFQDRRVGLGTNHGAAGEVALHRPLRVFLLAADGGGGHAQGVLRYRAQAVAAGFALHQFQAAALQRLLQCADRIVAAFHGARGAAGSQGRVEAQAQTAFGGDAVQGAGQRTGGHVVFADAVIGEGAAQRRGEEDGGGQQMRAEGHGRTGHW
ncbi:hypothetical protein D9M71_230440 [compost metagenome]